MSETQVLVVDDEELYRRALERLLKRAGHSVLTAENADEALAHVSGNPLDLVLCDLRLPGVDGLELVRRIRELHPDLPYILITGHGSPEHSIEALQAGAFWYLEKPFEGSNLDVVRCLVDQAIEHGRLRSENRRLQHALKAQYGFENIVGAGAGLRQVIETVSKVAETDSTVLLTGESGTGKEVLARAIHYNSHRANRALVTVNCGAIPEELLESELFGHTKGAFTNAVKQRVGRFAVADGGTIFLDEIGDMSPNLQVKLLRVLQEQTFEPVGSSKTVSVDVRVIAATNQDLPTAIAEKRFREDLFYRLNVIPIEVPPLRERREDVPLLLHHFLASLSERNGRSVKGLTDRALEALCDYPWPGNVRELENLVERLSVLREGRQIDLSDLPENVRLSGTGSRPARRSGFGSDLPDDGVAFQDLVGDYETDLILKALEKTEWNKNQAAKLLGLNRTTLLEKIKRRQIESPS